MQVLNQYVEEKSNHETRYDVTVLVNGLPLVVMELKSFDEDATDATLEHAYNQLGSNENKAGYRYDIPTLFTLTTETKPRPLVITPRLRRVTFLRITETSQRR